MNNGANTMIDYMVRDLLWNDYLVFQTEMEARDYVANELADNSDYNEDSFIIFKRERIA
jgi:hypothetical protein